MTRNQTDIQAAIGRMVFPVVTETFTWGPQQKKAASSRSEAGLRPGGRKWLHLLGVGGHPRMERARTLEKAHSEPESSRFSDCRQKVFGLDCVCIKKWLKVALRLISGPSARQNGCPHPPKIQDTAQSQLMGSLPVSCLLLSHPARL